MKRISYILALIMLVTLQAKAGSYVAGVNENGEYTHTNIDAYTVMSKIQDVPHFDVHYTSYDSQKNKVTLSARVYYPMGWKSDKEKIINYIFLACHPTVTSNLETPTGAEPVDGQVANLTGIFLESAVVIFPDYCGYGVSSHLQHPYLIHDVTARNCIDAVMAALEYIDDNTKWNYKRNAQTHILGYSQGGATALACTKYLESDACPTEVKEKINLYETACGDGPYSAVATVKQYLEWGDPNSYNGGADLEYSCVLPLIVAAAKEAYGDGCMRTVEVKDYFTDEFLSSGILDLIKTKGASTDVLAKAIGSVMKRQRPVDVFSENIIDKKTGKFKIYSKEYKCLMRALELGDLTIGWEPKHPIYVYHFQCDKVVPYANKVELFREGHIGGDENSGLVQYIGPVKANDFVDEYTMLSYAVDELKDIDYNNTSHADGGTIFYVDYMFGDALREVFVGPGFELLEYHFKGPGDFHKGIGIDR